MTKQALRQTFLARRRALPADEVDARSEQICLRLFEQDWITPNATIHTFLPILRQNEVNTWLIIQRLWHDFPQVQIAVPVTDADEYRLRHYELTSDTVLTENRWGIAEPSTESSLPIDTEAVDLVLVPLLVFDQRGHRVGYGGGFYDRFLAQCRTNCLKIGLSLFEPIESINDTVATDIPLDVALTPERVYIFK